MLTLIIILNLFVFCLAEVESKIQIECKCGLGLINRLIFEELKFGNQSLGSLTNNCDTKDFELCVKACYEKISNDTNQFDLSKPKAGDQQNITLGQKICEKTGIDLKDEKIIQFVTLKCHFDQQLEAQTGDSKSVSSAHSESSTTRAYELVFKQNLNCYNRTFNTNSNS